MIKRAVLAYLMADANVPKLAKGGIYSGKAPQNKRFPYITLLGPDETTLKAMDGLTGEGKATVSVECWALSDKDATDLASAVCVATGGSAGVPDASAYAGLDGFKGVMAGVKVQGSFLENKADAIPQPPQDASDVAIYLSTCDFTLWYEGDSV